jgi:hypothetical protein
MRSRFLLAALSLLAAAAGPARAAEPTAHAVFSLVGAARPDAQPRALDYLGVVASQDIEYAPGVQLMETPQDPASIYRYAARAGATLWRMKIAAPETEPAWCWREPSALWDHPFFCYVDRDRDGRFDITYEIAGGMMPGRILSWGRIKSHKLIPVAYRRLETAGLAPEQITLRYMGVDGGYVDPTGMIEDGVARFRATVGRGIGASMTLRDYLVHVRGGRAVFATPYGHKVEIQAAMADGHALIRLLAAPAPGPLPLAGAAEAP